MLNLFWLLFAHYLGDWALQNQFVAEYKGKRWYVMFSHCVIWTGCICIGLEYLGIMALWKIPFLLFGHWIVDKWKCLYPFIPQNWYLIYYDQTWHVAQVLIVFYF